MKSVYFLALILSCLVTLNTLEAKAAVYNCVSAETDPAMAFNVTVTEHDQTFADIVVKFPNQTPVLYLNAGYNKADSDGEKVSYQTEGMFVLIYKDPTQFSTVVIGDNGGTQARFAMYCHSAPQASQPAQVPQAPQVLMPVEAGYTEVAAPETQAIVNSLTAAVQNVVFSCQTKLVGGPDFSTYGYVYPRLPHHLYKKAVTGTDGSLVLRFDDDAAGDELMVSFFTVNASVKNVSAIKLYLFTGSDPKNPQVTGQVDCTPTAN